VLRRHGETVVVGNTNSRRRMNQTVLADPVNAQQRRCGTDDPPAVPALPV